MSDSDRKSPDDLWESFWKEIVTDSQGNIDPDQIKKELADFHYVIREVAKVYDHVTGGKLSKIMYPAEVVIREADDSYMRSADERVEDETAALTAELTAARAEIESLINCPAKMDEALGRKYLQAITENERLRPDAEKWRELTEASKLKALVPQECDRCDGVGWHEGGMVLETTCRRCGGSGVIFPAALPPVKLEGNKE